MHEKTELNNKYIEISDTKDKSLLFHLLPFSFYMYTVERVTERPLSFVSSILYSSLSVISSSEERP